MAKFGFDLHFKISEIVKLLANEHSLDETILLLFTKLHRKISGNHEADGPGYPPQMESPGTRPVPDVIPSICLSTLMANSVHPRLLFGWSNKSRAESGNSRNIPQPRFWALPTTGESCIGNDRKFTYWARITTINQSRAPCLHVFLLSTIAQIEHQGVPVSISFKKYHILHHRYQGDKTLDVDLPTKLEGRLFCTAGTKLLWLLFQPLFYSLRPLIVLPLPISKLEIINLVVQLTFDYWVYTFFGWKALVYLIAGTVLCMGVHPVAGHFISEHFVFNKDFETYSYYGILNHLTLNVGYHVEHHDFPYIPGSRLPLSLYFVVLQSIGGQATRETVDGVSNVGDWDQGVYLFCYEKHHFNEKKEVVRDLSSQVQCYVLKLLPKPVVRCLLKDSFRQLRLFCGSPCLCLSEIPFQLRQIAPEYYDTLPHHNSWIKVMCDFVSRSDVGPFARVKRDGKHNVKEICKL
ncbi:unnamed protein product [Calicophoron daubneyi]|uniref:Fatty acid desaturase domain-containing protein n=1 Tax=Calicophoron daubneyi TaxID=300641 RepID=A0AAV2TNV5_CALDB